MTTLATAIVYIAAALAIFGVAGIALHALGALLAWYERRRTRLSAAREREMRRAAAVAEFEEYQRRERG